MPGYRHIATVLTALAVLGAGAYAAAQADMQAAAGAPSPAAAAQQLGVDANSVARLDDAKIELARDVGRDVVCLCGTCPREPIADCTCGWAAMGRRTIQAAIAKGMTREQIVAGFRGAYGEKVLAMVPEDGFAQMAWIVPYAAAAVMLALFFVVGVRYRRNAREQATAEPPRAAETAPTESRAELARELDELD